MFELEDMDRLVSSIKAYQQLGECLELAVYCNQDYSHWFYHLNDDSVPHPVYRYPFTARVDLTPNCDEHDVADNILTQLTEG